MLTAFSYPTGRVPQATLHSDGNVCHLSEAVLFILRRSLACQFNGVKMSVC